MTSEASKPCDPHNACATHGRCWTHSDWNWPTLLPAGWTWYAQEYGAATNGVIPLQWGARVDDDNLVSPGGHVICESRERGDEAFSEVGRWVRERNDRDPPQWSNVLPRDWTWALVPFGVANRGMVPIRWCAHLQSHKTHGFVGPDGSAYFGAGYLTAAEVLEVGRHVVERNRREPPDGVEQLGTPLLAMGELRPALVRKEPERTFPVLWPYDRKETERLAELGCPRTVPWSLVEPHADWAMANHGQTLERLAERGGLAPSELAAVLERRMWKSMKAEDAVAVVLAALSAMGVKTDG